MDRRLVAATALTAIVAGAAGVGAGVLAGRAAGAPVGTVGTAAASGGGAVAGLSGVVGKVTEASAGGFTVRSADGSSRAVYVSRSTAFSKTDSATVEDVAVDTTITVRGTAKGDDGLAAETVAIGDARGGGPAGP